MGRTLHGYAWDSWPVVRHGSAVTTAMSIFTTTSQHSERRLVQRSAGSFNGEKKVFSLALFTCIDKQMCGGQDVVCMIVIGPTELLLA